MTNAVDMSRCTTLDQGDRVSRLVINAECWYCCYAGGELFSQRFEGYTLYVTALFEQVVVSWARPSLPHREVALVKGTLDNQWHWLALRYRPNPPSLLLEVDTDTQVRTHTHARV